MNRLEFAVLAATNQVLDELKVARETAERQGAEILKMNAERQERGSELIRWQGRAEAVESSLAEAKRLGGMLANAAYNICQRGEVDGTTLRSLNEAREAWDALPSSPKGGQNNG